MAIDLLFIYFRSLSFRRNAQYNASSTMHGYQQHTAAATNSNANSMQLMPYTAQTKTLNPDELNKLYNMNLYNRSMTAGMVNFPNQVPTAITIGHQPNNTTNMASQMPLAQVNTNPAQYLTSTPYLQHHQQQQQQGTVNLTRSLF